MVEMSVSHAAIKLYCWKVYLAVLLANQVKTIFNLLDWPGKKSYCAGTHAVASAAIAASAIPDADLQIVMKQLKGGSYLLSVNGSRAGSHNISILSNGSHIGSIQAGVLPAMPDGPSCTVRTANGSALPGSTTVSAGVELVIYVQMMDRFGNVVSDSLLEHLVAQAQSRAGTVPLAVAASPTAAAIYRFVQMVLFCAVHMFVPSELVCWAAMDQAHSKCC